MINKDRALFQYNSRDLVYIISPLTGQLHRVSGKVMIKYVGPVVIYKIIDPHNYHLKTLDGKPTMLRTSEENVSSLSQLKQVIIVGLSISLE